MFEDAVEKKEPAHRDFRGRRFPVAVVLDPEGAVERAGVDVVDTGRPIGTAIGEPGSAGNACFDQGEGDLIRALAADAVTVGGLTTRKHAGVEADQGEPFGLALRPAEAAKVRRSLGKSGSRRGGHGQSGAARRSRSPSARMTTGATVHVATGMTVRTPHRAGLRAGG